KTHHSWRRTSMNYNQKLRLLLSLLLVGMIVLMSACSDNGQAVNKLNEGLSVEERQQLSWEERKQLNGAAGEILYTTGFYYAASPPDIQVVVAKELGYFDELGLNVNIKPGLDAEGMKFLAAGQVQIA